MLSPSRLTKADSIPRATLRNTTLAALLAAAWALPAPAWAQTSVASGGNIGAVSDPVGVSLAATAKLFDPAAAAANYAYTLPGTAWGITSPAAGATITLNDGSGHTGYFNYAGAGAYTLTLVNPLTLTGGNNTGGGALYNTGPLTIAGQITLDHNTATGSGGGAIYTSGPLTIGDNASFSTNTASNSSGGAINSYADNVSIGDYASFSTNTATNGDGGGAIYNTGDNTTIGSYATFTGNTAGSSNGGAINTAGNTMMIGDHASFSANKAPNGVGGAIYFYYANTNDDTIGSDASFTDNVAQRGGAIYYDYNLNEKIGDNATLTGNTASIGPGGAIYFDGDLLTIGSNATLTGNQAGGLGGAIYANSANSVVTGSLTLNATSGHTVFEGNTQNTATATPQANAIYLSGYVGGSAAAALTFNTAAGGGVTLFDPIQNNPANGLVSVLATGGGAVTFDGADYSAPADQWSQLYGNTQVQSGATFTVQNGAVYGVLAGDVGQAAPSSFTVDAGTVLAGGGAGTVRADKFTLSGALNIASAAPATVASGHFSVFNIVSSSAGSVALGGTVNFNTCLNNGGTQLSDQLNLTTNGGAVTGQTALVIHPVSSPACRGAVTTGNGILLAQSDTSAPLFTDASSTVVVSNFNGYDYALKQVGNNWYLQSAISPLAASSSSAAAIPALEPAGLGLLAALLGLLAARRRRAI